MGIHATGFHQKMPQVQRGWGFSVNSKSLVGSVDGLYSWFAALADRFRRVRVCCGDWTRVLGPAVTTCIGTTAVFLDPPYDMRIVSNRESGRDGAAPSDKLYSHHSNDLSAAVRQWALKNGDNSDLRIALCGYAGEHDMPATWECIPWKSAGSYRSQSNGNGKANAGRERIWFSPACLGAPLFSGFADSTVSKK